MTDFKLEKVDTRQRDYGNSAELVFMFERYGPSCRIATSFKCGDSSEVVVAQLRGLASEIELAWCEERARNDLRCPNYELRCA